ncbi:MAG TPA: M48 family metalloprotease [Acidobacteriota bacterium]|nr:M48 family metalloprotease [Acidobacteriota bacterium]
MLRRFNFRKATAVLMLILFPVYSPLSLLLAGSGKQEAAPSAEDLRQYLDRSYLELFRNAPEWNFPQRPLEELEERLEDEKDREKDRLEDEKDRIEDEIDNAQEQLEDMNRNTEETPQASEKRHRLHCKIQHLRKELNEIELALDQGLDVRYDNKKAKVKVLREWPEEYRQLQAKIESGEVVERKFSAFRDIGFRSGPFENQKEDVETGREAIQRLKERDLLPPEVEDSEVMSYMNDLANRIARHSDLRVPLKLHVLKSEEINAFALPGGFLFINSGLITKAEKESELAGVVAHEIAHAAARHGNRLMSDAQIANIILQAAQVAALVLTGGASSIATYYALQYGFVGLGLVLNLTLLGVSRDFEEEADILGTQYLWDAGYDTSGFVSFFSRIAQEEGYITGLSWFRTHPPFYKRMSVTFREMTILPDKQEVIVDRPAFHEMKERLGQIIEEMSEQDKDAPTLKRVYNCPQMEDESESEAVSTTGAC